MMQFLHRLAQAQVGPKLPVAAWWAWRSLGFRRPATFAGRVAVGSRRGRLEWRQTGELLQAMAIFDSQGVWNRWAPARRIRTVLDVGANIGQTALYWALRFPGARVGAVEVMPENADRIEQHAYLNRRDLRVLRVAATDREGVVQVRLSHANSRNRLEEIVQVSAVRDNLRPEIVSMPALPLAKIMDRLGFTSVDLMKVDIEGAEVNLLRDVHQWAPRVHAAIIEIHDNVDRPWAERMLADAGYRVEVLAPGDNPTWLCTRTPGGEGHA